MAVQWVRLREGEILVASSRGAWIHQPELGAVGLSGPMPDSLPATHETTRHLLDGAIAAAERVAPRPQMPPMSARRWAWDLAGQWYGAHHSVALLPELIERYEAAGRYELAAFARQKLEEEQGHDELPLADLRALGYDAQALVQAVPAPRWVVAGLGYALDCVRGEHPVEFLGYVYALERRVLRFTDDWFIALEAVLPCGVEAASGLRAHATEFDAEHVNDAIAFFTSLSAGDRTRIAIGAYRTTQISCAGFAGQHPSEAELGRWLLPAQHAQVSAGDPSGRKQGGDS
jgi:hypothetical protein